MKNLFPATRWSVFLTLLFCGVCRITKDLPIALLFTCLLFAAAYFIDLQK